jgi:hypothetical protein
MVEVVDDDRNAADSVAAWLALELELAHEYQGVRLFRLGVPCRRRMTRAAETRPVFVDAEEDDEGAASWTNNNSDMAAETVTIADRVEEREISPARYSYECPIVLLHLAPEQARWAYETFKAVEFDSMYRLRDNANWETYVEELRDGMEKR